MHATKFEKFNSIHTNPTKIMKNFVYVILVGTALHFEDTMTTGMLGSDRANC